MSSALNEVRAVDIDAEEAHSIFDRICHAELGISGPVFMKGYRAGLYDNADDPQTSTVLAYLPFAAGL